MDQMGASAEPPQVDRGGLDLQPTQQCQTGLPNDVWSLIFQLVLDPASASSCQLLPKHKLRQLIRLSTVCKDYAMAAQATTLKYTSFSVGCVEDEQPWMGSKLMLQWAPWVRKLCIYQDDISHVAMKAFVRAASSLTEVELATDVSCTASIDDILCASSSLVTVRCRGLYLPLQLPYQIQVLQTCLEPTYNEASQDRPSSLHARFQELLTLVASMPHLQALDIACCGLKDLQGMSMPLPEIDVLTLHLRLEDFYLDISWLKKWRSRQLILHLEIWSREELAHTLVLDGLLIADIRDMRLIVSDCRGRGWPDQPPYAATYLPSYKRLAVYKQFSLEFRS